MTGSELGHYGTRSWWSGVFRTLCGQRFPRSRGASTWSTKACPDCVRIKKARGK